MKVISAVVFAVVSFAVFSQYNDSIFSRPDIAAEFPGGKDAMLLYLIRNISASNDVEPSEKYKGLYRLTIEKDGRISNVEILKSFPEIDRSAVKCFGSMPNWTPATFKGRVVRSTFSLPLTIHLTE